MWCAGVKGKTTAIVSTSTNILWSAAKCRIRTSEHSINGAGVGAAGSAGCSADCEMSATDAPLQARRACAISGEQGSNGHTCEQSHDRTDDRVVTEWVAVFCHDISSIQVQSKAAIAASVRCAEWPSASLGYRSERSLAGISADAACVLPLGPPIRPIR